MTDTIATLESAIAQATARVNEAAATLASLDKDIDAAVQLETDLATRRLDDASDKLANEHATASQAVEGLQRARSRAERERESFARVLASKQAALADARKQEALTALDAAERAAVDAEARLVADLQETTARAMTELVNAVERWESLVAERYAAVAKANELRGVLGQRPTNPRSLSILDLIEQNHTALLRLPLERGRKNAVSMLFPRCQ